MTGDGVKESSEVRSVKLNKEHTGWKEEGEEEPVLGKTNGWGDKKNETQYRVAAAFIRGALASCGEIWI